LLDVLLLAALFFSVISEFILSIKKPAEAGFLRGASY